MRHLTSARKSSKNKDPWAINSAVECYLHTVEVTGSNPVSPTTISFYINNFCDVFGPVKHKVCPKLCPKFVSL
jgi:hypothetical protein